MICPHCKENVLYKERYGRKCSKCHREFAFEPKLDAVGLHDIKFQKAVDKLSAGGKLYYTSGQLAHFLSRKHIKNTFHTVRAWILAIPLFTIFILVLTISFLGFFISLAVLLVISTVVAAISVTFWKREGNLILPVFNVEQDIVKRWFTIYGKKPANIISGGSLQEYSGVIQQARGVLICPEQEILICLAANLVAENLGLVLINPFSSSQSERSKLDFVRQRRDLPVFVLHDASITGCSLKNNFTTQFLGSDFSRNIIDIGLRPQMVMNSKLIRLRDKNQAVQNLQAQDLTSEETAWLKDGNYSPLLAITPAQLVNFVTSAVRKNYQRLGQKAAVKDEAQAIGFMTWAGQTK
jgi:hypothetical protein